MPVTPYVVGQWVREERFYGRQDLLAEILEGNRNCLWILGMRRIGKTSILKQLEHLTSTSQAPRYFPLFWDFQGSERVEDLHEGFREALLDGIDRLEALGIPLAEVESDDLFTSMARLRRELKARDLALLLLGDEVEELVGIHDKDPRFLRRLRRALQSPENIRTVFASTIRLWSLASEQATTSPFLHGFTPPLLVRGLTDDEARRLVRQSQLAEGARPRLDEQTVELIRGRCNNHPYLLQLLSERYGELQDLDAAIEGIAADQMVSFFFGADLAMLTEAERRILRLVDEGDGATSQSIREKLALESTSLDGALQRLEHLGFLRRSPEGEYSLVNYFFRRWFGELPKPVPGPPSGAAEEGTIRSSQVAAAVAGEARRRIDNRYELHALLGLGSSGEVYKAEDTLLRTVVAVKLLRPEYCLDEAAVERLRREVVLARDLSHPNILKIYHLGEDRGQRYITMQYVDGPDLGKILSAQAPLAADRAVALAAKLASALAALHRCEVLHRDIKPSNVLIDEAGEPRITDFGLARLQWAPSVTSAGTFLGTPAYASPEQALGESLDQRSDLYALGIVMFEMVTGRLPFVAESIQGLLFMRLRSEPPAPRDLVPSIPEALSNLILRCLARERAERFQSAAELHDALALLPRAGAPARTSPWVGTNRREGP
jgi:hypothetical protein